MPVPLYPGKLDSPEVLTPQAVVSFRRSLGRLPKVDPPESVIICLQRGLPERMRWRHPIRRAGRLVGDLFLLRRAKGKVGVMTNLGVGSPAIAALAEELIAWGVHRLVSMAMVGGLQPDLRMGSTVVCARALRDEGTSHHYLAPGRQVEADEALVRSIADGFTSRGLQCAVGTTWTTDAGFRETELEVRAMQAEGVLTVEMETAGLLAVAQRRKVAAASVLIVGDTLADLTWTAPKNVAIVERALEEAYGVILDVLEKSSQGVSGKSQVAS
jgi:uridine phosphorylase